MRNLVMKRAIFTGIQKFSTILTMNQNILFQGAQIYKDSPGINNGTEMFIKSFFKSNCLRNKK
ncbi:unnamed protein product [Larinioides sclopetarius]|uniref:Uncharacterized protein n=1 Tax=Larinioides sclopetarius TaxID=280406 RepID=A0AAV2A4D4_9ARAC